MTKYRWAVLSILVVALVAGIFCEAEPFRANDRVAFIGDSITHGGSYRTLIQTFYATRYPERNVVCFNVGISGDNAQGGYQRASAQGDGIWESDVRMYRPTGATIMLGMNDVGGGHFTASESKEELESQNAKQLGWYTHNYATLLDNLEKLGIERITLIKSSPYDQTMVNPEASENLLKFSIGKNDAIVTLGREVIDVESAKRGYPVCDFNAPMLAINARQQETDPAFSIIGNDRVHPGDDGHMVMAYTFLKFQGVEGPVAKMEIDADKGKVDSTVNCTVTGLKADRDGVHFTYVARALPFPRSPYASISSLIPFESEFNRERLAVNGLRKGEYSLNIGGISVGAFTAAELGEGVNLALLDNAPQVVQANEVLTLCRQRAELSRKIRAVVWSVGYLGKIKGHDARDKKANKAMVARIQAGEVPDGLWGAPGRYEKGLLKQYIELVDQYESMLQELGSMTAPLYAAAQPRPLDISLSRSTP